MPNTDPDPRTIALPPREGAVQLARKRFGFEDLRPGQLEAIDAVMAGHDVLVVMPTGAASRPSTSSWPCSCPGRRWSSRH